MHTDAASPAHAALPPSAPLRRLCLLVRLMVVVGALTLLALPWTWSSPELVRELWAHLQCGNTPHITVDARAQWLGAGLSLLPVGAGLFALWQLWQLFGEYTAGRVFSPTAQQRLLRFSWGVLALGLIGPLMRTLVALVLTLGNPPGQRLLMVGLGSDDYTTLLVGAVLLSIARVMAEGVRLAEENAGFV